jgi:hypothetical protein
MRRGPAGGHQRLRGDLSTDDVVVRRIGLSAPVGVVSKLHELEQFQHIAERCQHRRPHLRVLKAINSLRFIH